MRPAAATGHQLSPETWALLACAQAVIDERRLPVFREAVVACTSAQRLCSAAVRHGMVGHLHRLVAAQPDPSFAAFVAEPLAKLYRTSMQRNLHHAAFLLGVLDDFSGRGIAAMPLKGAAWAERLYGDPTLRNSIDLDLLVSYDHVAAVRADLLAKGFEDEVWFAERLLRPEWRAWGEIPFVHAQDDDLKVDVHWRMGVGQTAAALSAEAILARSQPLSLLGREVMSPSEADLLLITCLHGARHRWDRVEMVLSLAVQVRDLADDSWPGIMAAARHAGCERRVAIGVAHACRVLSLLLPPEVARRLEGDRMARSLLHSLTPATLCRPVGDAEATDPTHLLWTLATEDGAWPCLTHAAERLWRPGPEDWEAVELPGRWEWLYYPLRPARLALKWPRLLARVARSRDAATRS